MATRTASAIRDELASCVRRRDDMRRQIAALSSGIVSTTRLIDKLLAELSAVHVSELQTVADALVDEDGQPAQALPHARLI